MKKKREIYSPFLEKWENQLCNSCEFFKMMNIKAYPMCLKIDERKKGGSRKVRVGEALTSNLSF